MVYARNAQRPLAGQGYKELFTYTLDAGVFAQKLVLNVRSEENAKLELLNGPIIVQTTEDSQHTFEDPYYTEQYLELGFWSKTFVTPITAWRIRVADGILLPGLVDMIAYG